MSDKTVQAAVKALEAFAEAIDRGWDQSQTLAEVWGWTAPAVDKHDLYNLYYDLSVRVRKALGSEQSKSLIQLIEDIPARLQRMENDVVPHLYDGNAPAAGPLIMSYAHWLDQALNDYIPVSVDWTKPDVQKEMPRNLLRRIRGLNTQLAKLEGDAGALSTKIGQINDAHAAAEQLPTDLEEVQNSRKEAAELVEKISTFSADLLKKKNEIDENLGKIRKSQLEAKALVEQCGEAYSAATTMGLGAAFDQRAKRLANSMWVWSLFLMASLASGAYISHDRIEKVQEILTSDASSSQLIVSAILAMVSIAAPIWFAWVATKQIGQRFRLSEDYAFKASVAKAYEGYRREAMQIDKKLAGKLFGSALDRLEELPLRYVENDSHGSPFHEIATAGHRRTSLFRRNSDISNENYHSVEKKPSPEG